MLKFIRSTDRVVRANTKLALHHVNSLSVLQKAYTGLFFLIVILFSAVFITYHKAILRVIEAWKLDLVESRWKWLILVAITVLTSFPPLIGYSTSVTLAGYVFGFLKGWLIAVLGSVIGASITFVIYRRFLSAYAERMSNNRNFMALTQALDGKEGLTLLTMIRFCPFPFSLSNAALSTVPTITYSRFIFATSIGTLRLATHAFVGSRLAGLAERPESDRKSKIVNSVGIAGGMVIGILTGYIVYGRTKAIANRLAIERAQEEGAASANGFENDDIFSEDGYQENDSLLT